MSQKSFLISTKIPEISKIFKWRSYHVAASSHLSECAINWSSWRIGRPAALPLSMPTTIKLGDNTSSDITVLILSTTLVARIVNWHTCDVNWHTCDVNWHTLVQRHYYWLASSIISLTWPLTAQRLGQWTLPKATSSGATVYMGGIQISMCSTGQFRSYACGLNHWTQFWWRWPLFLGSASTSASTPVHNEPSI